MKGFLGFLVSMEELGCAAQAELPSQEKTGSVDQATPAKVFGYGEAGGKRRVDFHWGDVSDTRRYQPLAKIAVGRQAAGRGARDSRMVRKVDGVGNQRCGSVSPGPGFRQDGHCISYSE
jgi:hypothetical protein